jgi:hypothetical protein
MKSNTSATPDPTPTPLTPEQIAHRNQLRVAIAAQAMNGLLANIETCRVISGDAEDHKRDFCDEVAVVAVKHADALLAQIERTEA